MQFFKKHQLLKNKREIWRGKKSQQKQSGQYLFRSPLESSNDRVLNFIQVLDSLGSVNNNVGAHGVGTETPNLSGFGDIIFVLIGQVTATNLEVLFVANFALKSLKKKIIK